MIWQNCKKIIGIDNKWLGEGYGMLSG